ncbi:hypothetical protein D9757_007315 [Collybiopsis confluens]|uniref:Uncharacterized protein n=1 Tax=Collybiopsis confluens TaxID=2823264 RepID=A0A8H5M6Q4_9AGAR|nr:hypothetical protein D9757_007315 [Collybiopsis confluens]
MSAAARAEARRKAILSRGSDRLSKLTTSARGDSPVYVHDDPPLPNISRASAFVGEETASMPAPPRLSPSPSPRANRQASPSLHSEHQQPPAGPDPSVWSDAQQQQLMQALLGSMGSMAGMPGMPGLTGMGGGNGNSGQQATGTGNADSTMPSPFADNPLAAMLMHAGPAKSERWSAAGASQSKPPFLQKILPLIHFVALWSLLAYFVVYVEPRAHGVIAEGSSGILTRWAELTAKRPQDQMFSGWAVAAVPFFWAFVTLEVALYSLRIFYGFDAVHPPMLVAMALPHLPPPFPSIIINGMKYLQLGSILLDDLAILAVGVGFFIWIAGLLRS